VIKIEYTQNKSELREAILEAQDKLVVVLQNMGPTGFATPMLERYGLESLRSEVLSAVYDIVNILTAAEAKDPLKRDYEFQGDATYNSETRQFSKEVYESIDGTTEPTTYSGGLGNKVIGGSVTMDVQQGVGLKKNATTELASSTIDGRKAVMSGAFKPNVSVKITLSLEGVLRSGSLGKYGDAVDNKEIPIEIPLR
jgi:hypothetical protein